MGLLKRLSSRLKNKRGASRLVINSMQCECTNLSSGEVFPCFLIDVSTSGLGFYTKGERFPVGVAVKFQMGDEGDIPPFVGKIVIHEAVYAQSTLDGADLTRYSLEFDQKLDVEALALLSA